ncbi:PA2c domain-containing protein [Caerostris extrusa]|uniref:PA2c domain-containing protein n=1 Tax=Caerostris extrusa TaxID=172846 RepID=A0AAV4SAT4_CAEEX|nr:PA2c domain-containing protein [Caerostris extrusa]
MDFKNRLSNKGSALDFLIGLSWNCVFWLSRDVLRINTGDAKQNLTQAHNLFTCKGSGRMSSIASMIFLLCLGLLLISTIGDASLQKGSSIRRRRSLMNLSSMVSDITGRQSTDFVSYGNYCGLGGAGEPVDPIDE